MSAPDIIAALKGRWHGSYGTARCPAHKDKSPSLSVSIGADGKTLVKCHAGCSQDRVIGALTALGVWESGASNLRPFHPEPNRNGDNARRLWSETVPALGTLVEKYLASRSITLEIPKAIRFHPELKHPDGGKWPGMVALVKRNGEPVAIHRTFLKKDGSGKAPVPRPKMMLGPCHGGAVRLAEPGEILCVGEGIETCLSVLQETGKPTWAALSTSGLKALELPEIVREVTLIADADQAGEEAAIYAGRKWRAARVGLVAKIVRPTAGYSDFNEQLQQKNNGAGQ